MRIPRKIKKRLRTAQRGASMQKVGMAMFAVECGKMQVMKIMALPRPVETPVNDWKVWKAKEIAQTAINTHRSMIKIFESR